jgi:uncharacterized protein (DUF1778 family)
MNPMFRWFILATTNLADLVRAVLRLPRANAFQEGHMRLSERDSLRVLDVLKNPPAAPNRLVRVARAHFTIQ